MTVEQLITQLTSELTKVRSQMATARGHLVQLEEQFTDLEKTEQQLLGALAALNQLEK